jgi:hypothetical protein
MCRGRSASIVDWTTRRSGLDPRQWQRIFPLTSVTRPALRPTHPPVQWVPGVLSSGLKRGRGVTLTTHRVPRSRMSRSCTPLHPSTMACSGTAFANYTSVTHHVRRQEAGSTTFVFVWSDFLICHHDLMTYAT